MAGTTRGIYQEPAESGMLVRGEESGEVAEAEALGMANIERPTSNIEAKSSPAAGRGKVKRADEAGSRPTGDDSARILSMR
jgi:hypothetical protein